MKYKLINKQTGEEYLCEKVVIDGWDYYVSDEKYIEDELLYCVANGWLQKARVEHLVEQRGNDNQWKKVIASNNPNIDVPKVVDEVEMLAHKHFAKERFNWEQENPNGIKSPQSLIEHYNRTFTPIFRAGYNKSQETHPFSEEDIIEFMDWYKSKFVQIYDKKTKLHQISLTNPKTELTTKELLQLWKEQRIKTIYYE